MLTYPGFNKVAFELGPIKVHWYGIMYLLGFAAARWLARRRAAQPGSTWKKNDVDDVIFFELGPIKVHWYGIMYLLGFAAARWLARRRAAQPGSTWKKNDVDDVIFFAMLGVILGGRIGYVLF